MLRARDIVERIIGARAVASSVEGDGVAEVGVEGASV